MGNGGDPAQANDTHNATTGTTFLFCRYRSYQTCSIGFLFVVVYLGIAFAVGHPYPYTRTSTPTAARVQTHRHKHISISCQVRLD